MLRCGKCGNTLYSAARKTSRRYVCKAGPDFRGCGRLTIVAPPVEELLSESVLYRLDTQEFADAVAGRAAQDEQAAVLAVELAASRARLDELAELYASEQISVREWMTARRPIEERAKDTERRLARHTRTDALNGFIGNATELRSRWTDLNLTRQAAIIGAILDHAVIGPGTRGARELDPSRVGPMWRL